MELITMLGFGTIGIFVGWMFLKYIDSQKPRQKNPYEEMAYQEEVARQEARRDFQREKFNQIKKRSWENNLQKNIQRSWGL